MGGFISPTYSQSTQDHFPKINEKRPLERTWFLHLSETCTFVYQIAQYSFMLLRYLPIDFRINCIKPAGILETSSANFKISILCGLWTLLIIVERVPNFHLKMEFQVQTMSSASHFHTFTSSRLKITMFLRYVQCT